MARWLLDDLEQAANGNGGAEKAEEPGATAPPLPDYAARRRRIFGDKVLPNMVLAARAEEPW